MKKYLTNVCVALSILLAALLGGQYRQSTSSMVHDRGFLLGIAFIDWLFQDDRHCFDSWVRHQKRRRT